MTKATHLVVGAACFLLASCSQFPGMPLINSFSSAEVPVDQVLEAGKSQDPALDQSLCKVDADTLDSYALPESVDLWDRIRSGFSIPEQHDERVDQALRWYARHPHYMTRVAERGTPYLHHIVAELESRDMPLEFALLPIVESAFDPFAYSHGRASGMWQFVPSTAKYLGLKLNWWYDGRRDVTASTDAALRYLEKLSNAYDGDWLLALAAYNGGRGNVSKAIRRNKALGKPTDFWSLDLPKETEAYVPRLLALKTLISQPEEYDLSLLHIPDAPYFAAVDVGSQIDLAQAAELAEMSMEDFYLLNPGFNRWATDPEGPHQILVPLDRAEMVRTKLGAMPQDQRVTWDRYKIKAGDSLSTIAARYKISVDGLKAVNNLNSHIIRQGDILMVPVATEGKSHYAFSAEQRLKKTRSRSAKNADGEKVTYEVQAGDSFWTISRRYDVGVRELAKWNGMAPGDPLQIGQKLVIWSKVEAPRTASRSVVRKVNYQVREGDSLWHIASRFRVSVADIQKWNQIHASKYLQPGQALTLFVDVTKR